MDYHDPVKRNVFFLHSAGKQGSHEGSYDLVAWLSSRLGDEYQIKHPIMPNPDNPDYEPWAKQLQKELEQLKGEVLLIGHSVGGSVLLKYLTEHKVHFGIKGLFLCATPFWGIDNDWQYEPFILPENFSELLPDIGKVYLYHSKDDPIVTLKHAERYKQELPKTELNIVKGSSHAFENGIEQLVQDIKSATERH